MLPVALLSTSISFLLIPAAAQTGQNTSTLKICHLMFFFYQQRRQDCFFWYRPPESNRTIPLSACAVGVKEQDRPTAIKKGGENGNLFSFLYYTTFLRKCQYIVFLSKYMPNILCFWSKSSQSCTRVCTDVKTACGIRRPPMCRGRVRRLTLQGRRRHHRGGFCPFGQR